ncbi:MAG: TlpA family protein disulfide reductase, partial [Candidatus Eremiobacteraeota bacterium]|nr:TlpA family protein disulfide reductase [Candidatus Eremiobacteraeota bacterium]
LWRGPLVTMKSEIIRSKRIAGWPYILAVVAALSAIALFPQPRHKLHLMLAGALPLPTAPESKRLAIGDNFTPLAMQPVHGTDSTIKHRPHRPLLINVFTTWCPPCQQEMPALTRFSKEFGGSLDIVGIDQEQNPEIVDSFEHSFGANFPTYIDNRHLTEKIFSARFIPTTVLVSADNKVMSIHHGPLTYPDFVTMAKTGGHGSI